MRGVPRPRPGRGRRALPALPRRGRRRRLTQAAHVLFGSGDPRRAAAAAGVACARCHVEHRGRHAALSAVAETQCASCHFRRFAAHPEFALLRGPPPSRRAFSSAQAAPGIVAEGEGPRGRCGVRRVPRARRLRPRLHGPRLRPPCASCHAASGSLGAWRPCPTRMRLRPRHPGLGAEGACSRARPTTRSAADAWARRCSITATNGCFSTCAGCAASSPGRLRAERARCWPGSAASSAGWPWPRPWPG